MQTRCQRLDWAGHHLTKPTNPCSKKNKSSQTDTSATVFRINLLPSTTDYSVDQVLQVPDRSDRSDLKVILQGWGTHPEEVRLVGNGSTWKLFEIVDANNSRWLLGRATKNSSDRAVLLVPQTVQP